VELKKLSANGPTKLSKMLIALKSGMKISPRDAWVMWNMQANTYHRTIHSLKKKGWNVKTTIVRENGRVYTIAEMEGIR